MSILGTTSTTFGADILFGNKDCIVYDCIVHDCIAHDCIVHDCVPMNMPQHTHAHMPKNTCACVQLLLFANFPSLSYNCVIQWDEPLSH